VGGPNDNSNVGAAWVFTRSAGVWAQQGSKLVGSGANPSYQQDHGSSVDLSADGNTAIVGGRAADKNVGAAWVWTRNGGVWTQQAKLVGTGYSGAPGQGGSVALSADGNTAIVGGSIDNNRLGAAWVFTRSGGNWTQQGSKLVGSGYVGAAEQGTSVALSGDGKIALVGGPLDNRSSTSLATGATWVWTRSGSAWTQQGPKLVAAGKAGPANQGTSVALSANGGTALIGEPEYDASVAGGAVSVFVNPVAPIVPAVPSTSSEP
jgi:hypothetical protein